MKPHSSMTVLGSGSVVGFLGGLIGLGGAEFRLPLLINVFGFGALQAVILNKALSLVVVASSLPFRARSVPISTVLQRWDIVVTLLAGSLIGAWIGCGLGNENEVAIPSSSSRSAPDRHRRSLDLEPRTPCLHCRAADRSVTGSHWHNGRFWYRSRGFSHGRRWWRTTYTEHRSSVRGGHQIGRELVAGRELAYDDRRVHPLQP
jgi:hypothetical protein